MITVIKRERKLKTSIALYLDYRIAGKRKQEPTGLHIFQGKDDRTKQLNKENLIRFELLRNEKQVQLLNGVYALPVNKQKIDFIQYCKDYFQKNSSRGRQANSVLKNLVAYNGAATLPLAAIDETFLNGFKNALERDYNGETPYIYFKLLCKAIRQATKERLFTVNPTEDIVIKRMSGIPKDTLTLDELKVLYATPCSNVGVKNAFLFCCFTGLRYGDVTKLKWENIQDEIISIVQAKTGHTLTGPLHTSAVNLLGPAQNACDLVFNLPTSTNGYNKVVNGWLKKAGIEKHITSHCGRHTFATLLVSNGADILSISTLMGHKTIKYTQRYTRVDDSVRRKAIQKLPVL